MPPRESSTASGSGESLADLDSFEENRALRHARLPQYAASDDFRNRFLEAAHTEDSDIARAMPVPSKDRIWTAEQTELNVDLLSYFVARKAELEAEFVGDLSDLIGKAKAALFCDTIAKEWFDGKRKRITGNVLALKRSIKAYLEAIIRNGMTIDRIVTLSGLDAGGAMLTTEEIAKVLTLNDRMMGVVVDDWIAARPSSRNISRSEIFYRRGIILRDLFEHQHEFIEHDYISSYTLAMSVAEKFSQNVKRDAAGIPAIISADCDYFAGRILFFSGFIPGMDPRQLEIGMIPSDRPDTLTYQGIHAGVAEYLVGEHPITGTEDPVV
jgi:hypothetical protein